MATIWRALATAILLLWGWVVVTGVSAGTSPEALQRHLLVGLVATVAAALVQSVPFAYFLGTHFWIKAFARAARAGDSWSERHKQWMRGRAYPALYLAPLLTMGVAIAGSLVETDRIPHLVHPLLVGAALVAQLVAFALVPGAMRRNSALMDELAATHHVPRPGTPAMERLLAEEERVALPPLFQLSRVLLFFSVQSVFLWLYLRYGTEGWRATPLPPFVLAGALLLTLGLGLNARHDPQQPATSARAWTRAVTVGAAAGGVLLWLARWL